MQAVDTQTHARPGSLAVAVRNRYYFGKLLDVVHFDIEQEYFNSKRWLINRMVLGYGVVCGLDVQLRSNDKTVVVTAGLAIDKCGRELVVPVDSRELDLPAAPAPQPGGGLANGPAPQPAPDNGCDETGCFSLYICYHECPSSPEPALGDDCGQQSCVASLVQERYKLEWRKGKAPDPPCEDCSADFWSGDKINRKAVAMRVTQSCPTMPCDCCLPLANLRLPTPDGATPANIDITIRPIVYTNDLLFELINSQYSDQKPRIRGGK